MTVIRNTVAGVQWSDTGADVAVCTGDTGTGVVGCTSATGTDMASIQDTV